MGYTLTKAELTSLIDSAGSIANTQNLYAVTGKFAFGELLNLELELTSANAFVVGQKFIFNPCFFAASPYANQYPFAQGWLIEYVAASTFNISVLLGTNQLLTGINYQLSVTETSSTVWALNLQFYAAQDQFAYMQNSINNSQFLLSAGIGQGELQAGQNNAYSAILSYLEFIFYEVNSAGQPFPTPPATDPYVRNTANPGQKQNSFAVAGRFVDNAVGNSQAYPAIPPFELVKNNMEAVVVEAVGFTKITDISRLGYPVLSTYNDANFNVAINDGQLQNQLMMTNQNTVKLSFYSPEFVPTKIVLRLLRVDSQALQSAQLAPIEYAIQSIDLPFADPTAYPNYINSTPFSTPASVGIVGSAVNIEVQLDTNLLTIGASYRIWAGLYNAASNVVSSHITPPLWLTLQRPPTLTITGSNSSYNNDFTGNDTVMTTLARHRAAVVLDSSTYTGLSFINELKIIKVSAYIDGNLLENASYNFATNTPSTGEPVISLNVAGSNYLFSYISRLPFNNTLSNKTLTIEWTARFDYTDSFGNSQQVTYLYTQYIRVRPLNTARITNIELLDYDSFLIGSDVPIFSICDDNPLIVIKTTKSGAPDANLIALAIIGAAQNSTNPPLISEEESYISPTALPQLSSPFLSQVDSTFGDDFAYFVLDTRLLPANNLFNNVGSIIYDI
jgi:hypothetical protein